MRRIVGTLVQSREFMVRTLALTINKLSVIRGSRVDTRTRVCARGLEWEMGTGRDADMEDVAQVVKAVQPN